MASRKDYYNILGIRRGATEEEIEKAYRKLARTYQFDFHSGNKTTESRFKEIAEAYEVLSNKEKRARYDHSGTKSPFPDLCWDDLPEEEEEEENLNFEGFEDVFARYFRGAEPETSRRPQRGKDLECAVKVDFEEMFHGKTVEVQVLRETPCPRCLGRKADPDWPRKVCGECGGAGQVQIGLPPTTFSHVCPRCQGRGKISVTVCQACLGKGWLYQKDYVSLQIPAGVKDLCCIYLKGMGQMGRNSGPKGDLVARVEVQRHPFFQRKEDNVCVEVPLTVWEAALGTEVEVPTLNGSAKIQIPAGMQSGDSIRLPGKGFPLFYREGRGDEVISFKIVIPRDLDERSKEILEELKQRNPENPRQRCGWPLKS